MHNNMNIFETYFTATIVTDKDYDPIKVYDPLMINECKRVQIDNEILFLDLNAKPPYKLHTFEVRTDTDTVSTIASINLKNCSIEHIFRYGDSLKSLSIFNLLTYLGIDITSLPFDYCNLDQFSCLEKHLILRNYGNTTASIYELYNLFFENNPIEAIVERVKNGDKFNVRGYSPYLITSLMERGQYFILGEIINNDQSINFIKHFIKDLDKMFEGLVEASNKNELKVMEYEGLRNLCKDEDIRHYAFMHLDSVGVFFVNAVLPDLLRNKKSYLIRNPYIRRKLLSNKDQSVRELLINYIGCIPKGFEGDREDFIGLKNTSLYKKLSSPSKGIYNVINTRNSIFKHESFNSNLKIISLYDDGYEKSALLLVLAKLYIEVLKEIYDTFKADNIIDVFQFMEYMFKTEDLNDFIEHFVNELVQLDSEMFSKIVTKLYSDVKGNGGILFNELYIELEKTRAYKRYKLESSLIK